MFEDGYTIKDAAARLEINYSTAKHILKVYRKTGLYRKLKQLEPHDNSGIK